MSTMFMKPKHASHDTFSGGCMTRTTNTNTASARTEEQRRASPLNNATEILSFSRRLCLNELVFRQSGFDWKLRICAFHFNGNLPPSHFQKSPILLFWISLSYLEHWGKHLKIKALMAAVILIKKKKKNEPGAQSPLFTSVVITIS